MSLCKICDNLNCDNYLCRKAIEFVKKRIKRQNERYMKIMGTKLCKEKDCKEVITYPRQLCDKHKEERRLQRKENDAERRRKKRTCKNGKCGKAMPRSVTNAQKYCSEGCRPSKIKKPVAVKKKPLVKATRGKEKKKYDIDPYWLTRGTISTGGERMFGHGKSITRL